MNDTTIKTWKSEEPVRVSLTETSKMDNKMKINSCECVTANDVGQIVNNIFKLGDEYIKRLISLTDISDFVQELDKIVSHVENMTELRKMFCKKNVNQKLLNLFEKYRYRYMFLEEKQKYLCSDLETWLKVSEEKCKYFQRIDEECSSLKVLYDTLNGAYSFQRELLKETIDNVETWFTNLKLIDGEILPHLSDMYQKCYKKLTENNTWDAIQGTKMFLKSYQDAVKRLEDTISLK